MAEGRRAARVAERMRDELSRALLRELKDPRLEGVIISRVEMSGDLQVAWVYVRLAAGADDVALKRALVGLRSASGKLRRVLCATLDLRRAPEMRFAYDEGVDAAARMNQLLREIEDEKKPQ